MHVRGIRGATTAVANSADAIQDATRELLLAVVRANQVESDEIAAVFFTATPDLNATYPAEAARQLGWQTVPLLSFADLAVPGSLPRCIRVLLLWNTPRAQEEVVHVYLRGAEVLRPDLAGPGVGAAADDA
ncbi:MAG: chorismate mutase [Armatimonadota bacterium]|nr:chorismate mutase [Armatimonadota bacterium]MDR7549780.1 chorismate mutase [Armatimonadota bacterium]